MVYINFLLQDNLRKMWEIWKVIERDKKVFERSPHWLKKKIRLLKWSWDLSSIKWHCSGGKPAPRLSCSSALNVWAGLPMTDRCDRRMMHPCWVRAYLCANTAPELVLLSLGINMALARQWVFESSCSHAAANLVQFLQAALLRKAAEDWNYPVIFLSECS